MTFATNRPSQNTLLYLIWQALQAGGGGGSPAANVGVINSSSTRINPSTLELQQALVASSFLPTVWEATGAGVGYAIGDYLIQRNTSVTATPNYRWYVVNSTGAVSQLGGDVPSTDRQIASGSGSTTTTTGVNFVPVAWEATATADNYATGQVLILGDVSTTATPDYRWFVYESITNTISETTNPVPLGNRRVAGGTATSDIAASDTVTRTQIFSVLATLNNPLTIPADGGLEALSVTLDTNTAIGDWQSGDSIFITAVDGSSTAIFTVASATGTTINANFQLNTGYSQPTDVLPAGSYVVGQRRLPAPVANFKQARITVDVTPASNLKAFIGTAAEITASQAGLDDTVRWSDRDINPARDPGRKLGNGADDPILTAAELTSARLMFQVTPDDIDAHVSFIQYSRA